MILLEPSSYILEESLLQRFTRYEAVDIQLVDFDGVRYHLSTPTSRTELLLSMAVPCFEELVSHGAQDIIQKEYSAHLAPEVEQGYNVSLKFDLENVPDDSGKYPALAKRIGLLKRNVFAAPYEKAFKEWETELQEPGSLMTIHYREEEAIYIRASEDRVTVIFSTLFKEEMDRIFGRVFLQEFVDARRLASIQNAPQVLYSNREPPLEIRHLPNLKDDESVGYVTFVLFPRHFEHPEVREKTISDIQLFRDYLHYHIKCSKAYMHSRMRARVQDFLKVLNRAKPERTTSNEKKLAR
ncbi:arp2/3 complex subunit [Dimargaris cristalligena]|uniref:Arp2/3 complex 34 kDa subunit n=1 Tax=Dimargaris cristalligena TaxID=215637 RepID=A0A4P9ZR17_9FUNG|nr:arp2/3 complex subunit [Dimargaris cristalligena]|eukprot:RKP35181.1 arp2/3 complex subunit [Dimargaris cristalligena]